MREFLRNDRVVFLTCVCLLQIIGMIFVYSIVNLSSLESESLAITAYSKELLSILLGVIVLVVAYFVPIKVYYKLVMPLYFGTLVLLVLVLFTEPINGANRWFNLGYINFQPSELTKFTIIIYLAYYFDNKDAEGLKNFARGFLPSSIALGVMAGLVLAEPDYGTTFLIVIVALSVYFFGGFRLGHIMAVALFLIPVMGSLLLLSNYRLERFLSFLNPGADRLGSGYQLLESIIAVGNGGLTGVGIGNSVQKLFYLPEAHNDFIFAIISEDLGFIGAVAVILIFLMMFMKGLRLAMKCNRKFHRLVILGFTNMIFFQALIHIMVVLGLVPTKGINLPFISYGGSSTVILYFMVGVIMRASIEEEHNNGQER